MKDAKNIIEIKKILENHERRLSILEGCPATAEKRSSWYKPGGTIDKIVKLISEGFFNDPKSLKDIIFKLEENDFHLEPSDLTLPLRRVVRKGLLKKIKQLSSGAVSKKWLYIKP